MHGSATNAVYWSTRLPELAEGYSAVFLSNSHLAIVRPMPLPPQRAPFPWMSTTSNSSSGSMEFYADDQQAADWRGLFCGLQANSTDSPYQKVSRL